jgi:catechol 2,3-dioxygenase-like lactoylglutathione lyase family enzyme
MANVSLEGLTLHVADLERSLAFYTRLPGTVVEVHQPELFAMVRIGRGRLGLLQRAAGRFHVELEVDDLDAFYEEVRRAGIEPKGAPVRHSWGERDFQVVDPDGFVLEFEAGADES